jgi:hypothetical protein
MGSHGNPMENILRGFKRHTSEELRSAIIKHPGKSRKEWMLKLMREAGEANSIIVAAAQSSYLVG